MSMQFNVWTKSMLTALLIALVALSWTRHLDTYAQAVTAEHFKSALAAAALARAFNGVISVAQGTEVAIQPVGVGVTLTLGEILDPINDLVERFSALALVASAALLIQLTLSQIVTSSWLAGGVTVGVMGFLLLLWRTGRLSTSSGWLRCVMGLLFVRFLLALVLIATHWINSNFLNEMLTSSMANLGAASASLETLETGHPATTDDDSFLERTADGLARMFDNSKESLDVQTRLETLKSQIEDSVEDIIRLIVVFALQTIIIPLLAAWLCWWLTKIVWSRTRPQLPVS